MTTRKVDMREPIVKRYKSKGRTLRGLKSPTHQMHDIGFSIYCDMLDYDVSEDGDTISLKPFQIAKNYAERHHIDVIYRPYIPSRNGLMRNMEIYGKSII